MTLKLYRHVTDSRQKVPHGFVLVTSPLLLRVSLGRLLRGRVTGGVLGLSDVNYEVLVQLLSVDVMKFTLAEISKEINKGKDVECEARNVVMHLSMVCPRMGGGAGNPRKFDFLKLYQGGDFDIHNGPLAGWKI